MTAKNRAGLITKLQTSLKKHYKPAPAAPGRPLMEHVLYAALLEDAPVDIADEGFAKCEQEFFDWNEVRVTSVTELAEVLSHFPSPATTATRLKRCLQSVFESFYSFEIEHLKKENLGKAVAKFESMNGVSPFVLSYLIQHGLGGHAIPVNSSGMWIMFKTGIVSEAEARTGKVPGLERAIPKSKAIEFSSMLHQAAVTLAADATSKQVWEIVWSVNKDAEMSPSQAESKRKSAKRSAAAAAQAKLEAKSEAKTGGKSKPPAAKPPAAKLPAAKPPADAETPAKPAATKSASKSKTVGDRGKATEESTKAVKPEAAAATVESSTKSKSKAKPTTAEKAKPAEAKKKAEPKKPAEPKDAAGKPSAGAKATPSPKPTAAAKPASVAGEKRPKGDSVSKEPAKDAPAKSTKKPISAKATPTAAAGNEPEPVEPTPAKESAKKAGPKKAKEPAPAADAGNQKLTKRKPR